MADVNKRLREEISYLSRLINTHKKQEINRSASKPFVYQYPRSKNFRNTVFGYCSSYNSDIIQNKSFKKTNVDRVVRNPNVRINPYKIDRTVKGKPLSTKCHPLLSRSSTFSSGAKTFPSSLQSKATQSQKDLFNKSVTKPENSSFISNTVVAQEPILVTFENNKSSLPVMQAVKKLSLGVSPKRWTTNNATVKCVAKPSSGPGTTESNLQPPKFINSSKSKRIIKSKYKLINTEKKRFKDTHNILQSKVRTGRCILQNMRSYSPSRWKIGAKGKWSLPRTPSAYHNHNQYSKWKNSYYGHYQISILHKHVTQRKMRKSHFPAPHRALNRSSRQVAKCSSIQPKMVMIGGLLYKASNMKLSRASKSSRKQITQNGSKLQALLIRGVRYQMDPSGMTLKRVSSQPLRKGSPTGAIKHGLKRIDLGGSTYIQTQPGILTKTESAQTRTFVSRVVNRSIHRVLAATEKKLRSKNNMYCMFYNRFGRCNKGDECPYKHDPDKVAVCMRFLRGTCKVVDCPFSHKVAPEKMPVCSFYLQGRCNSESCPYRHVKVSRSAEVCKDFLRGYCPAGEKCKKRHTLVCQEYAQKGSCKNRSKCPLHHPLKKGQKKKKTDNNTLLEAPTPETLKQECVQSGSELPVPNGHIETSKICEPLPSFIALEKDEKEGCLPIKSASTVKREALRIRPNFLSKGTLGVIPSVPGK